MKLKLGILTFACSLCLIAGGLTLGVGSASASGLYLENWGFDPGTGVVSPIDAIGLHGTALVNGTGGTNFAEYGTFQSDAFQNDGSNILSGVSGLGANYELTMVLSNATGYYTPVDATHNALTFTSADLNIYLDTNLDYGSTTNDFGASNGTPVASFTLKEGSGSISLTGGVQPADGSTDLTFTAVSLAPGYWFDENGTDLSTLGNLVVGFTDTNNQVLYPTGTNIITAYTADSGLTVPTSNGPNDFFVSSGGHVHLGEVPEPTTMLLMGLGLFGLAAPKMRKKRGSQE
jgi:hypothetical protein